MYSNGGDNIKIKNTIVFILILFLFVSLVGVVCASEDSAMNNITLTDTGDAISQSMSSDSLMDELQISEDNEILSADHDLSGSTLQQIQQYFDNGNVAEGDTVYLGNNDITSSWSDYNGGPININVANIVITGGSISNPNGFSTINANTGKVFSFNAPGITLNNVKILNSNGGNGPASALYVDASDCTINNCLFDNCQYQGGGAVHISDQGTNTKFNNCNFTNNVGRHSNSGGAVFIEASDCEFTGCNFEEDSAAHVGAIHVASVFNLKICLEIDGT